MEKKKWKPMQMSYQTEKNNQSYTQRKYAWKWCKQIKTIKTIEL